MSPDLETNLNPDDTGLLAQIGFRPSEIDIVRRLAAAQALSVPALLRAAVRAYQVSVTPVPELSVGGCSADD